MDIITYQNELRPALPNVFGPKDYRDFRATLEEMDHILTVSGIEHRTISQKVYDEDGPLSIKRQEFLFGKYRRDLRYGILLGTMGESYRNLALRVADSQLLQWFTHTGLIDAVHPLSKSSIERGEKLFTNDEISNLIHELNRAVNDKDGAERLLYRETEIYFDEIFADTTCVKSHVHFPVDWVLFRDAARTLINAIILIRNHGLYHRIKDPSLFITAMNKLSIEMTHTRKKKGAKKARKVVLRRMKKLMKTIEGHARNYIQLLEEHWEETDWSEAEARIVLQRIENILTQLPQAVHQAHERIIGERRVPNKDKILSFYDKDVRVLVRGKDGAEVEFGNALYLAEQIDGLIVDWDFIQEQPPGDNKLTPESLMRIRNEYGTISSYTADRGFDSPENTLELEEWDILNAICPRSIKKLEENLEDERFCRLQKRRGATEARIGIFKNAYLGKPLRSKGFDHREIRIGWCVLTHNLWKLAIMAAEQRKKNEESHPQSA